MKVVKKSLSIKEKNKLLDMIQDYGSAQFRHGLDFVHESKDYDEWSSTQKWHDILTYVYTLTDHSTKKDV